MGRARGLRGGRVCRRLLPGLRPSGVCRLYLCLLSVAVGKKAPNRHSLPPKALGGEKILTRKMPAISIKRFKLFFKVNKCRQMILLSTVKPGLGTWAAPLCYFKMRIIQKKAVAGSPQAGRGPNSVWWIPNPTTRTQEWLRCPVGRPSLLPVPADTASACGTGGHRFFASL